MACSFYEADDIHDAAGDASDAINARLGRRGLQLEPSDWQTVRDAVLEALGDAAVVNVA